MPRERVRIANGTVVTDRGRALRGAPIWVYKWGTENGLTEYARDSEYYALLCRLGINAVRVVCFDPWQRSHGYPHYAFHEVGHVDRAHFLRELDAVVDLAGRHGLYALVNYHDVGKCDFEHVSAFWALVAPRYADRPHVLYEVANEPVPWLPGDWDDAAIHDHQALHDLVRAVAPATHLLLCSFANTFDPGRTMAEVAGCFDVDWSSASVAFHCYGTDGTSAPILATRERFSVVATEVDIPKHRGGDPHIVPMDGEEWASETMERLGISWFAWRAEGYDFLRTNFVEGILGDAVAKGYAWEHDGDPADEASTGERGTAR